MFCRHCGSRIPDDSTFCPQCGASLVAPPEMPPPPPALSNTPPPPPPPPPARTREQIEADDRALFDLMDFEKINTIHHQFVEYFSAHDYPRMRDTCETGSKVVGDLMSRLLVLHPSSRLEPIKEGYSTYLLDAKNMFENYKAAAEAFGQGQENIGVKMASYGNANATTMNEHTDRLTKLFDELSKG